MNNIIAKPRQFVFAIVLALLVIATFTINTGAVYAAPEDERISVEIRFTEGETPSIPDNIVQGGIEYRLISSGAPVLESTLPIMRTYNYAIGGSITPAQLATIQGTENLSVRPVYVAREHEVDKVYTQVQEHNEVEGMIPEKMNFDVASATSPSGFENKTLDRAGISWTNVDIDGDGLPDEHTATVLYRGIETRSELGYYIAEMAYQTRVQEGSVDQYIIVAVYEPINPTTGPESIGTMTPIPVPLDSGDPSLTIGDQEVATSTLSPEDQARLDAQTGNVLQDIASGNVPLGNSSIDYAWSLASMFFAIISVLLALLTLFSSIRNRNSSVIIQESASIINFRKMLIRTLVFITSALTILIWLLFDYLAGPMVWINDFTIFVGILLVVNAAVFVIYALMNRKKESAVDMEAVA